MKKALLALAVAGASQFSHALCSYPLDATAAQYSQLSQTTFDSVSGQSADSLVTGSFINPQALSTGGAAAEINALGTGGSGGDIALPSSGIVAFEFSIDSFPSVAETSLSNGAIVLGSGFSSGNNPYNAAGGDALLFDLIAVDQASGSGGTGVGTAIAPFIVAHNGTLVGATASAPAIPVTLPLPAGYRIGYYLNMSTHQLGYTVNGVDQGYVTQDTNGNPFTIPAGVTHVLMGIYGISSVPVTDANVGAHIGGTLITDSSQFTQPFPAGTTDICGVAIPSVGPGHGHGHAYGHDKHHGDDGDDGGED